MTKSQNPVKPPRRKRQPAKMNGPAKFLVTALSLGAFLGGWNLIARQEELSQVGDALSSSPPLGGNEGGWGKSPASPTPIRHLIPGPTPTPWPTIEPLVTLPPIPTVAPLPAGRFFGDALSSSPPLGGNEGGRGTGLGQIEPLTDVSISVALIPTLAPLPTLVPAPTLPPTPAPLSSSAQPITAPPVAPGNFDLLAPLNASTSGPTDFEWLWNGPIPENHGFEVMVWRDGEPLAGAHDAVADNLAGRITFLGNNRYHLHLDISQVAGVQGRNGDYLWTVSLVQISPNYANTGIQAPPARLYFDAGGGGSSSGGGGGGSHSSKGS